MDSIRQTGDMSFEDIASIAKRGVYSLIAIPETFDHTGRARKAWYPDLHLTRPQLQVTLHTDSFADAPNEEVKVRDWLIETGQPRLGKNNEPDIDLRITAPRQHPTMKWIARLPRLENQQASNRMHALYQRSLQENWEQTKNPEEPPAVLVDLLLHSELKRHLFVTLNRDLYNFVIQPGWNHNTLVLGASEARHYVDLYLKAFGTYRVRPRYTVNRGLYHWLRLWNLVPAFQSAWPYAVYGRDTLHNGPDIMAFMHNLYARIIGQMQTHDRIGWLRYIPATNDTCDEMLNLLNYFIVLATGIFDSLAWLAVHRFALQENRLNITARAERPVGTPNPFFRQLDTVAPDLADHLRDSDRQAKIALFYGPRDSVQHRLVLTGVHLNTGQYLSDCNVAKLNQEHAAAIQSVDSVDVENTPFTTWGLLTFAEDGETFLEPYRFTRTALRFMLSLVNEVLELLDFASWIDTQPSLKGVADNTINEARSENGISFAVPYP